MIDVYTVSSLLAKSVIALALLVSSVSNEISEDGLMASKTETLINNLQLYNISLEVSSQYLGFYSTAMD